MITERTLKKWRKEALVDLKTLEGWDSAVENTQTLREQATRILRMTQELLDLHLVRKS